MAVTININGLTLAHKGDGGGISVATVPDVCKTPPTPVPVPYPNISRATDLAKGTTTVKVDGGNMAANKGSEFSKSSGDEAGTVGGVKSGTNMAESTWLSYSMDVFLEGQNACRLTDKKLMNHGNTVNMGGFLTQWLKDARAGRADCPALLRKIDEVLNGNKSAGTAPQRGVKERWFDQIRGAHGPGTDSWRGHELQFMSTQIHLASLLTAYATYCGGGPPPPPDAYFWAHRRAPVPAQWVAPAASQATSTATSSSGGGWSWGQVGWGVAAVGLSVVTVVAVVSPFDGPVEDVAAGSGAAAAWARAFGTAAVAVP
ncbi:MAG: DUF4150 domain-containing protein [Deltaproteobacteria bacterium]|nr:DUF4150 domain-containing protein [Deltaproteobacteria bacterium]